MQIPYQKNLQTGVSMRPLTTKDSVCEAFTNLCFTPFKNNTPADLNHSVLLYSALFILVRNSNSNMDAGESPAVGKVEQTASNH